MSGLKKCSHERMRKWGRVMLRQRWTRLLAVVALAFGSLVAAVTLAAAPASAAACSGTYSNYFDEYNSDYEAYPTEIWGASANMRYEQDNPCTGGASPNIGAAWVMVYNVSTGGYAQTGQFYSPGNNTCMEHFVESVASAGDISTYEQWFWGYPSGNCAANDQVHTDWVTYNAAYHHFDMNVDTQHIDSSHFDPATAWVGDTTTMQLSGEVNYLTSNMPGIAGARSTDFSNITYSPANNGAFIGTCGHMNISWTLNGNPTKWGQHQVSCNEDQIYTSVAQ